MSCIKQQRSPRAKQSEWGVKQQTNNNKEEECQNWRMDMNKMSNRNAVFGSLWKSYDPVRYLVN